MQRLANPYLLADDLEWQIVEANRVEISRGDVGLDASLVEGLDPDTAVSPEDPNADAKRLSAQTRRDAQVNDCFDHLEYRARAFGSAYLFSVEKEVLRLRNDRVSDDEALVYRFLLACGRPELSNRLGSSFSELCKLAIHRFFGGRACVFNMDAGATDRKRVGTDTRKAARFLAPHLGALADESMLSDLSGAGDGGADIVASIAFMDGASGHLSLLGQCAASSAEAYWKDKLHQPRRFQQLFRWTAEPMIAAFIPVLYRTSSGDWVSKPDVAQSLVFDRLRIVRALDLGNEVLPKIVRDRILRSLKIAKQNKRQKMVIHGIRGRTERAGRKKKF